MGKKGTFLSLSLALKKKETKNEIAVHPTFFSKSRGHLEFRWSRFHNDKHWKFNMLSQSKEKTLIFYRFDKIPVIYLICESKSTRVLSCVLGPLKLRSALSIPSRIWACSHFVDSTFWCLFIAPFPPFNEHFHAPEESTKNQGFSNYTSKAHSRTQH